MTRTVSARWADAGLRDRVRLAFLAVGLVGVVGIGFIAYTFSALIDARTRLADELDPAGVQTRRWVSAVVDQESGVRGFALSADEAFLAPYTSGLAAATDAEARVRRLIEGDTALLALADRFAEDTRTWRTEAAEPLLATTRDDGSEAVSETQLADAKLAFDELRASYREFQDAVDLERADARAQLDRHTDELIRATLLAVLLAAVGLALTWVAMNRWVVAPVAELGRDVRRVASGDLRHHVAATGPPDLRHLGDDVEAMRQRIVDELTLVEESRRQLEEQAADLSRSNQELEQFAYVASHDLQEPLRKITGFCQLLQRRYGGQLDDRADEYIAFAVDGAKRMQTLINDLLAFSRVGRTNAAFQQVDLGPVAASAVAALDELVADTGATVTVATLPTVEGDPSLLELLFQNLVANALKFRSEAVPVVSITARPSPDGLGYELACTDNGIGIDAAYAERVFVIFQRLHGREQYEGTGIGLALCRKVVEFHGGRIWIDPEPPPGGGTTIRWTLARRLVHEHPSHPDAVDRPEEQP